MSGAPASDRLLSIVLPAHDERAAIEGSVRDAVSVARRLAPGAAEVIVVDDASTDGTGELLDQLAATIDEVEVVHLDRNGGHGPALLVGFDRAVGRWIAHLDSDDQIPADQLDALWAVRDGTPLVLGVRVARDDPRHRLVVTVLARQVASRLAGRPLADANVPCKVIERSLWAEVRPLLADDTFAPSVALAVVAARRGVEIAEVPVQHRARAHGTSSLHPLKLVRALALTARQTVAVARAVR